MKCNWRKWTGFLWLNIGSVMEFCEDGIEPRVQQGDADLISV